VVRDAERYERVCDPCFAALVAPRGSHHGSSAVMSPLAMTPARTPTRSQFLPIKASSSGSSSGGSGGSGSSTGSGIRGGSATTWQDMYAQVDDDDEGEQELDAPVHGRVPGIRTSVDVVSSSSSSDSSSRSDERKGSWAILATARELEEEDDEEEAENEASRAAADENEAAGVAAATTAAAATAVAVATGAAFQSSGSSGSRGSGSRKGRNDQANDDDVEDDEAAERFVLGAPEGSDNNDAGAPQDQVLKPPGLPLWASIVEKEDTVDSAVDDATDASVVANDDEPCHEDRETPNHPQIHFEPSPDKEMELWSLPSWFPIWVGGGHGALMHES